MSRKRKSRKSLSPHESTSQRRSRTQKVGLAPGTLVYTGIKRTDDVVMTVTDYDREHYREFHPKTVEECLPLKNSPTVSWINVDGLHQIELIEQFGQAFQIHPLVQEDLLDTGQRSKMEQHDEQLFFVLKVFHQSVPEGRLETEQIGMVLGSRYVLTFQERAENFLEGLKNRIAASNRSRIRSLGSDYLAYAVMDFVVDSYFTTLERLENEVDRIEEKLIQNPTDDLLGEIYQIKRELLFFRKTVWPVRVMVSEMRKEEMTLLSPPLEPFLQDLSDHLIHLMEGIDTLREVITGLQETHQTAVGNRLNRVMQLLTIVATIFIPLTFIAGIYGMNFEYMPELEWRWGYPAILGLMLILGGGMMTVFKWKKWL